MRMPFFLTALALLLLSNCTKKIKTTTNSIKHSYQFSAQIKKTLHQDSSIWKYEPAAWAYSRIGAYTLALEEWENSRTALKEAYNYVDLDSMDTSNFLATHTAQDAKTHILAAATNTRLLLINEAHHQARHRKFTTTLLSELRTLGYTHIGFEAIVDELSDMKAYPFRDRGFYTEEPQFGNLIRTALDEGFILFGYDEDDTSGKEREELQAQRIAQILQENPTAKVIVHLGFGHLWEDEASQTMGYFLRANHQIDPLTVDQVRYSEQKSNQFEQPLYQHLALEQSTVFLDQSNKTSFQRPGHNSPKVDITIFHPRTTFIHNRPNWLEETNHHIQTINIPAPETEIACPCLVFAFKADEDMQQAIPIDLIETDTYNSPVALALSSGSYTILVQNELNEGFSFPIEVK